MKPLFLLRPDITFLNFGSFGATPRPVFEEYQRFQLELELEPVQFIVNNGPKYLKESREALASFLTCLPDDLIFVPNPTHAVNLVAKNLKLNKGDEVLTTNIEYGACDRTWKYYCKEVGANYIQVPITLPLKSKKQFLDEFWSGATANTRLVFMSQITSATGLILPVKEIVEEARRRGIPVFIDGAHVPGHIDLNLTELDADYYTGACHKWMMTPKGSSFLYVKSTLQHALDPLIVSWGYEADYPSGSQFYDYHQFNGTRDFSAYLTIPKALEFRKQYHWLDVIETAVNRVHDWLPRLCTLVGSKPLAPVTREFIGQMGSIPIRCSDPLKLKAYLYHELFIEIPVMVQNGETYLRFSVNGFNDNKDLEKLENAILHCLELGLIEKII